MATRQVHEDIERAAMLAGYTTHVCGTVGASAQRNGSLSTAGAKGKRNEVLARQLLDNGLEEDSVHQVDWCE